MVDKVCFTELHLLDRYTTNRNDLIAEFYRPCLERAVTYDRAVGYFRSSILLLAAGPIAAFAMKGARIRLICSPELSEQDITAIQQGYNLREKIGESLSLMIKYAFEDPEGRPVIEFLATLVATGCLNIQIAFRPGALGIFHDKIGIFRDYDDHTVSFTGSSNETFHAWNATGNHESFDVFRSWTPEVTRTTQHAGYFERLWSNLEPGVEVIPFPDVARERLVAVSNPEGIEAAYEQIAKSRARTKKAPQLHQLAAIAAWERKGKKGILQHATGSGKTFTAITAMREWLRIGHPVIVLVPSELLLNQWYDEIRSELGDAAPKILAVGAGNTLWRRVDVVEGFTTPQDGPRITLATLQTASSSEFCNRVQGGDHLFLVIDEVHRAGGPKLSRVLSINAGPRLGLSATPFRYGDVVGTKRILDYFGGVIEPPFTLADAITAGRLCGYTYHIHTIVLSQEETKQWKTLTEEIKRNIARSHHSHAGEQQLSDYTKLLLIRRADIVKTASAKVPLAVEVLGKNYSDGHRWLVYCDDQTQMKKVIAACRKAGLPSEEYHSAMQGDQHATLDHFLTKGGVLVAIKCLDEGVDIPTVDHALILASSRNPREFIQRRGRVLRMAPGKFSAEIHDAVVAPPLDSSEPDELAILRGELARAVQFAEGATNAAVKFTLRQLARDNGIDPDGIVALAGIENEED